MLPGEMGERFKVITLARGLHEPSQVSDSGTSRRASERYDAGGS